MKANVKGFSFEVTVNGKFACASWDESSLHKDIDDERNSSSKGEGLDVSFGVSIRTGADEYQGEVDLREFAEAVKTAVDISIKDQIKQQLGEVKRDLKEDIKKETSKE